MTNEWTKCTHSKKNKQNHKKTHTTFRLYEHLADQMKLTRSDNYANT